MWIIVCVYWLVLWIILWIDSVWYFYYRTRESIPSHSKPKETDEKAREIKNHNSRWEQSVALLSLHLYLWTLFQLIPAKHDWMNVTSLPAQCTYSENIVQFKTICYNYIKKNHLIVRLLMNNKTYTIVKFQCGVTITESNQIACWLVPCTTRVNLPQVKHTFFSFFSPFLFLIYFIFDKIREMDFANV